MLNIKEDENGVVFKVRIQPRASSNEITGLFDDAVKIKLTAPPVDGEANKSCILFLSKVFNKPKKSVELVAGQTSQIKRVRVYGINKEKTLKVLGLGSRC